MITLKKDDDDSNIESYCVEKKQNKDTGLKMACLSPFVPFGLVLAFQAWLSPFWPVFGLSDTLYNLTICEKDVICVQSSNFLHTTIVVKLTTKQH